MVIGGDDINNDIITLGTCFSMLVYIHAHFHFMLIGRNLTAQSMGSHMGIGVGIQISETQLQALLPFRHQSAPDSLLAGWGQNDRLPLDYLLSHFIP